MVAIVYEGGMQLDSGRSWWGWVESGDHLWYYNEKGSVNFAPLKKVSLFFRQWLIRHNIRFELTGYESPYEYEQRIAWIETEFRNHQLYNQTKVGE